MILAKIMNCTNYSLPHILEINLNFAKKDYRGGETGNQKGFHFGISVIQLHLLGSYMSEL